MGKATMRKGLSSKTELSLTTLAHNPSLTRGLSEYGLRMFVTSDGVYVGTQPVSEDSYIECNIQMKGKNAVDYISTENEDFSLLVDVKNKGKKTTYSSFSYYNRQSGKQRTINNPEFKNQDKDNGFVEAVRQLIFKPKIKK